VQADRKTEILGAFTRLVSRFGVDKTTMQDIAKEVGISVGVIYKDFTNKEDLITAYFNSKEQQFGALCQKLCEKELPPEQLLHYFIVGIFKNATKLAVEDRGFWQMCQDIETIKLLHKNCKQPHEIGRRLLTMVETIINHGVAAGVFVISGDDAGTTAQLFLKAFESYWKEIFLGVDPKQTLQDIDLMYNFVIRAIQKNAL
jgi:AcrR family transcriptional regulator